MKSLIGSDGSSKTYLYKKGQSKPIASSTGGMRKLIYMGGDEKYLFKTKFPLEKGTYYLKVSKNDKKDSIYYSIKWK